MLSLVSPARDLLLNISAIIIRPSKNIPSEASNKFGEETCIFYQMI